MLHLYNTTQLEDLAEKPRELLSSSADPYKPDGKSSMTAILEWGFLCELKYICICVSNTQSKQE